MPTQKKEQEVALLEEKLKSASSFVFTDYVGLNASEMFELRRELHQEGIEYRVVKNRLVKIAADHVDMDVDGLIEGPTGICFGYDDPAAPFRVAKKLSNKFKPYKLNGGYFEGQKVDAAEVSKLADLPTREEALSRLAGVFQAPMQKLASSLAGNMRNLAVALSEVGKTKE
jgi:large subunit ribosomal protein L10